MRPIAITTLLILLALVIVGASPVAAAWSASVRVDTVTAAPGDQVAVPVRLVNNDLEISGLYVPLRLTSPYLSLDSVSFAGSIMTADFSGLVNPPDYSSDTVEITLSPNFGDVIPTLPAVDGLIATLYISVSPGAAMATTAIDSVAIDSLISDGGPGARVFIHVNASDSEGVTLLPSFVPGAVKVDHGTDINDDPLNSLPASFELAQNYPNPFNPTTTIEFALPVSGKARLAVYNVLGQEVAVLVDRHLPAGTHAFEFDASNRPSGIYFYRLSHPEGIETKKMTLIK